MKHHDRLYNHDECDQSASVALHAASLARVPNSSAISSRLEAGTPAMNPTKTRVLRIVVAIILVLLFLFGLGALLGQIFRSAIFGL